MDVRDKVLSALSEALDPEYVRLEDDDGISGFVVARQFRNMSTLDRQEMIGKAVSKAGLNQQERRQVLMIAGLTPEEYSAVGARIRVHRIKEMASGVIDVLLHGGLPDAEYVRGALNNQKGVQTTEPKPVTGAPGVLMGFRATGTGTDPLTKAKVSRILKKDPYIEVMPNA